MRIVPILGVLLATQAPAAHAAVFVNGGFESGSFSGWTQGAGSRTRVQNSALTTAALLPGGALYDSTYLRSSVVNSTFVDPNVGALLGGPVYSGSFSGRVEDLTNGGFASVISQTVTNYTDPNIFFAWKAVLENGAHTAEQSAEMLIELTDNTKGTVAIRRQFNAGASGVGVDSRFSVTSDFYYTPAWQIEQLTLDTASIGDTFTLSVLAADCQPAGHTGYVFLDGFGAVTPPPIDPGTGNVPAPAGLAVVAIGACALGAARRRG